MHLTRFERVQNVATFIVFGVVGYLIGDANDFSTLSMVMIVWGFMSIPSTAVMLDLFETK